MRLKKQKTNKLFFGEYPYKVSTRVEGAGLLRIKGVEYARKLCVSNAQTFLYNYNNIDRPKLLKYLDILEQFKDQPIKMRIEGGTVNLFVKDQDLYKKLQTEFVNYIVFISEPANKTELETLTTNKKYILCDELPKGKFKFRATLRSRMPRNVRENLSNWLIKYSDSDIHLTPANLELLKSGKHWWNDCSIYVSNDKMLTLLTLASSGYLRKTEEFVVRSSINNISKGELLC